MTRNRRRGPANQSEPLMKPCLARGIRTRSSHVDSLSGCHSVNGRLRCNKNGSSDVNFRIRGMNDPTFDLPHPFPSPAPERKDPKNGKNSIMTEEKSHLPGRRSSTSSADGMSRRQKNILRIRCVMSCNRQTSLHGVA